MTAEPTPCWYTDCDVTIPRKQEFVPIGDGQMQERFIEDKRAMQAHLSEAHPPKHTTPTWSGGWA